MGAINLGRAYEDTDNLRCAQLFCSEAPLDDFLDRSPEGRHSDPDRLPTILEGSYEDSTEATPDDTRSELLALSQVLLCKGDEDLQKELEDTVAEID